MNVFEAIRENGITSRQAVEHCGIKINRSGMAVCPFHTIPTDETGTDESFSVKEHTRKAKSKQSDVFKGVPSRDEIIPLPEDQKYYTKCRSEMKVIDREFVRREFHFTPAKGEVVNIYVETAKCPVCSEAPAMEKAVQFVKSHAPEALIPHSYASVSVVVRVMYQKYANSMPLYRQEQDWKQLGVMLNRTTLANWIIYCATQYFRPFYDHLHRELLKREFLMADETRIQVLTTKRRMVHIYCSIRLCQRIYALILH